MIKKLEKRIEKIKKTIETKDYEFEEIYDSKAGKIFSNHIKETGIFCQKYFFIPMFVSFSILIQKMLQWTQTEEYKELIKEKVKDEKDEEMLRLFHEYQKIEPNWIEDTGLDYFTDEKEQMRFFAYLTITTVSYFEIYVRNTIDEIQDKLLKNYDYYTNKYGIEIKNILKKLNKTERNNAKLQIDNLLESLNIKESFSEFLSQYEFKIYPMVVEAIIELRNNIIHNKPFPDLSILDEPKVKSLKQYIESNKIDLNIKEGGDLNNYEKAPSIFKTIFDELVNMFEPKIILMSLMQEIPEIINLYAGFFDNIVDLYFNK